jgi:hypothetical protein
VPRQAENASTRHCKRGERDHGAIERQVRERDLTDQGDKAELPQHALIQVATAPSIAMRSDMIITSVKPDGHLGRKRRHPS